MARGTGNEPGRKGRRTRKIAGARDANGATAADEAPQRDAGGGTLEWIKSLGVAVVLFLILRTFLIQTFVITSGSMEESLLVGDFLMVNRLALGSRVPGT